MEYSEKLCNGFIPELRNALNAVKRKAVSVRMGKDRYALQTMPESLNFLRRVADKPFFLCEEEPLAVPNGEKRPERDDPPCFLRYNLPLWSSKYGGFGFLPKSVEYPRHRNTNTPLALLAQLNLDELPHYGVNGAASLPPDFPTEGILAFYTDPFDDLYGLESDNLGKENSQIGYRVLYFPPEQVEEELYAHIRPLLEAEEPDFVQQVERAVGARLWSREEQYQVFANCGCEKDIWWFSPDAFTEDEKKAFGEFRKEELWKTFGGAVNQALSTFNGKGTGQNITCPRLWYGDPISCECAARLGPAMEMLPLRSVEFVNDVLRAAREEHPQLKDANFYSPPLEDDYQFTDVESYWRDGAGDGEEDRHSSVYDFSSQASHLGGFPRFTQQDPRREVSLEDADPAPVSEEAQLLLQLSECNENLMFGDAGECNFFITRTNLQKKQFDQAWFNWDCS